MVLSLVSWASARLLAPPPPPPPPPPLPCACSANWIATPTAPRDRRPLAATLVLPGYGILFFHQLGMLAHLGERGLFAAAAAGPPPYEALVGSSAGALAAVLASCAVCPDRALRAAHALCVRAGLYPSADGGGSHDGLFGLVSRLLLRPCALVGRWGALVRAWLDELLPDDAHARAEAARVGVAVTRVRFDAYALPFVPSLATETLTSFASRADLIDALAASAHVPLFMDGRLWACAGGGGRRRRHGGGEGGASSSEEARPLERFVDGSLLHLLLGEARGGLVPAASCASCSAPKRRVVVLDPLRDPGMAASSGWGGGRLLLLRCLSLPTLSSALGLAARGRAHAAELERGGAFEGLLPMPGDAKGASRGEGNITVLARAGGSSDSLASSASGASEAPSSWFSSR
jgi:predicted acylesterase/phospholipase RssA